jgi:hypothetical protein
MTTNKGALPKGGAEVYDTVRPFPAGIKTIRDTDGTFKGRSDKSLERFIALHEDVQRELIKQGMAIHQRAKFRMSAVQARHIARLREYVAEAIKTGDPDLIKKAQADYDYYMRNKTDVIYDRSDIDFYIMLHREDGREFFVEVEGKGDRGFDILKNSLTH